MPSTRFGQILNCPIFHKNGTLLELLNVVFENNLLTGFFGEIKENSIAVPKIIDKRCSRKSTAPNLLVV